MLQLLAVQRRVVPDVLWIVDRLVPGEKPQAVRAVAVVVDQQAQAVRLDVCKHLGAQRVAQRIVAARRQQRACIDKGTGLRVHHPRLYQVRLDQDAFIINVAAQAMEARPGRRDDGEKQASIPQELILRQQGIGRARWIDMAHDAHR